MRALVTGATGFVGSHVADLLLERGFEVCCTYRKTSNLQWLKDKPIDLIEAGFSDKKALLKATEGCDYIFHVGGLVAARNLEEFMRGNRDATENLILAANENAPSLKRFIYISSQTAAGPSPAADRPLTENDTPNPITAYGRSKKAAEDIVLKYKDTLPVTIIRPPAVYGPRDTAILQIFQVVKKGFATMMGFNKKYVSLVHSSDLARGICDSITTEQTLGETYFVSSEEFYTWETLMDIIKRGIGRKSIMKIHVPHFIVMSAAGLSELFGKFSSKPPVFNLDKGRDFIQSYWICSVDKAKRDFNYTQQMPLEKGIFETIRWYEQQKWL